MVTANCHTRGSSLIGLSEVWLNKVGMDISGSSLSPCSFIYYHKGGYTGIEEPNSIWPDWFNLVPALVSLSSVPLSTTPPVASVHYLQQLYVVVLRFGCSHFSSQRGPQSRALPLVGPIPCCLQTTHLESGASAISLETWSTSKLWGTATSPHANVTSTPDSLVLLVQWCGSSQVLSDKPRYPPTMDTMLSSILDSVPQ